MSHPDFDLIIIGAGSGGVRAARFAAARGARVAIIEAGRLGGTCVNVGCIPKKLLSYAAHYHEDFSDAAGFGWTTSRPTHDWATLIAAKDNEIERLNRVYGSLLRDSGVEIITGWARLLDAHTVGVDERKFGAAYILIATGGKPVRPELEGAELGLVSDDVFSLAELPRRVIVNGSGYIAVEFASILNGLGAHTTIVHRSAILKNFDHDLGAHLRSEMVKKGVQLRSATHLTRIEKTESGLHVSLSDGREDDVDAVLFATGRIPRTEGMGLTDIGVHLGATGAIAVNSELQSSVPSIYAIGDVIDRVQLTPVALAEGMQVAAALFGEGERKVSYENIPTAIFSHPNVATVGLSESAAQAAGFEIVIFKSDFRALKHTISQRAERTLMKLVVDRNSDRVLGVHMVGPDAGEVIQGFAVALNCGATKTQFDATLGIHPTLAEELVSMREPVS